MADKIRIGIDNEASPELRKIAGDVQDVGDAAQGAERQLNDAGDAVGKFTDKADNVGGMANRFTELNNAIELLKKGFEIANAGLLALEANGNPAALKLRTSFEGLQRSLLDVGDSRAAQAMLEQLSGFIDEQLSPALEALPGLLDSIGDAAGSTLSQMSQWFGDAQNAVSNLTLSAGEYFGVFAEGTAEELKLTRESRAALDEKNRSLAELEATQGRILAAEKLLADARDKAAEQDALSQLAKLDSERMILDLLEEERDAILEAAKAGTDGADDQEAALRRVEILERRLIDVRKDAADTEVQNQTDIQTARDASERKLQQQIQDGIKAQMEAGKALREAEADRLAEESKKLEGLIAEAKSLMAYQQKEQTPTEDRNAAVKKAQDAARQKAADEGASKAEQEKAAREAGKEAFRDFGKANDPQQALRDEVVKQAQERARQQAQASGQGAGQQAAAARQAGVQAFRGFNAGQTSETDIAGAQNSLIQAQAQQAQSRGQLDQQTVQALTQAANNQQQLAAAQQAQAQQLQQVQQALGVVNNTARSVGNTARAQRGGYGR